MNLFFYPFLQFLIQGKCSLTITKRIIEIHTCEKHGYFMEYIITSMTLGVTSSMSVNYEFKYKLRQFESINPIESLIIKMLCY